jgi:S-adenosyl methyltransferase
MRRSVDGRADPARWTRAELIDPAAANPARTADFLDGGRDNFAADRKAARLMMAAAPVVRVIVPAARAFHRRMVRHLVAEAGVRQFLDIGAGLATSGRTHQLAQSVDPRCRIVYVDVDPMVLSHARALTNSAPEGAVGYVDAHIGNPGAIVAGAAATLDFGEQVAVMLLSTSTLAFIADTAAAAASVSALAAAIPSGSYVGLYHQASDLDPALRKGIRRWNKMSAQPITLRSRAEVALLVEGLAPVPPGLVPITEWRPEPDDPRYDRVVPVYGVLARKP